MVEVATRLVYRASELNDLLGKTPSLVAMAHSDPRIDPAYLFLRAEAKQSGPVAAVVFDHGHPVGCLYAVEDCIRGTRSGMFSIGDRTGAGLLLAGPKQDTDQADSRTSVVRLPFKRPLIKAARFIASPGSNESFRSLGGPIQGCHFVIQYKPAGCRDAGCPINAWCRHLSLSGSRIFHTVPTYRLGSASNRVLPPPLR